jgi:hypothetical protein
MWIIFILSLAHGDVLSKGSMYQDGQACVTDAQLINEHFKSEGDNDKYTLCLFTHSRKAV